MVVINDLTSMKKNNFDEVVSSIACYLKPDVLKDEYKQFVDSGNFKIKEVDKYLLESLYKFADRIGCIYLCNLIYEHDKEKFKNPLLEEKSFLIKSSVFTPPNNFLEDYWVKHHIPFKNLDEVY